MSSASGLRNEGDEETDTVYSRCVAHSPFLRFTFRGLHES